MTQAEYDFRRLHGLIAAAIQAAVTEHGVKAQDIYVAVPERWWLTKVAPENRFNQVAVSGVGFVEVRVNHALLSVAVFVRDGGSVHGTAAD